MIRFACPKCKAVIKVDDPRAGEKVFCPKCGQKLLVPKPTALTGERAHTILGRLEPTAGQTTLAVESTPANPLDFSQQPPTAAFVPSQVSFPTAVPVASQSGYLEPHRGTAILVMGILGLFTAPFVLG